jgi:hypothetical protein
MGVLRASFFSWEHSPWHSLHRCSGKGVWKRALLTEFLRAPLLMLGSVRKTWTRIRTSVQVIQAAGCSIFKIRLLQYVLEFAQTTLSYTNIHTQNPFPLDRGAWATPATTRPAVNSQQIPNTSHARAPPFARRSILWPRLRLVSFSRCVPAARCASPHASRRCS